MEYCGTLLYSQTCMVMSNLWGSANAVQFPALGNLYTTYLNFIQALCVFTMLLYWIWINWCFVWLLSTFWLSSSYSTAFLYIWIRKDMILRARTDTMIRYNGAHDQLAFIHRRFFFNFLSNHSEMLIHWCTRGNNDFQVGVLFNECILTFY